MIFSIARRYDPCDVWLEPPPTDERPVLTVTICPTVVLGIDGLS